MMETKHIKAIMDTVMTLLKLKAQQTSQTPREQIDGWAADMEKYLHLLIHVCHMLDINPKDICGPDAHHVVIDRILHSHQLYELKRLDKELDNKAINMKEMVDKVKGYLSAVRIETETNLDQMKDKMKYYENKSKQYYVKTKETEQELKTSGYIVDLSTESIEKLRESNRILREKFNATRDRLKRYEDFEPNNASLRKAIAEMKAEYEGIDSEL